MPEQTSPSMPLWLVITLPFLYFLIFPLFWCLLCAAIARVSGWKRLATDYASDAPASGPRLSMQSGAFNWLGYNNCLTVHVSEQGIHLAIMALFRIGHQPLLIPWKDIHNLREEPMLWTKGCAMDIGDPKIAKLKLRHKVYLEVRKLIGEPSE